MTALNALLHELEPSVDESSADDSEASRDPEPDAQQLELRSTAIAIDANATNTVSLTPIWRDLTQGRCSVVDGFFSDDRCHLLLAPNAPVLARPLETRRLAILEAVLRGAPQKCIAIDHRLAPSTIALHAKLALEGLGVSERPSRTHPLLMRVARSESKPAEARYSSCLAENGRKLWVVSMPRPERPLRAVLPLAEFEVIRSLVEGLSYQNIALQRGTSSRTVANQISAVFRRLRVSGRNALVERLFVDQETRANRKKHHEECEPTHRRLPAAAQ